MNDEIQNRFDAGDLQGTVRLLARQQIAEGERAARDSVYEAFILAHPKIEKDPQFWGRLLGATIRKMGKIWERASLQDLEEAWVILNRPGPNASLHQRAPQAPAPAPAVSEPEPTAPIPSDDRLTAAARFLIELKNWDRSSIEGMSTRQFEEELARNGLAFSRAVEILCPPATARPKTRGELAAESEARELEHQRQKAEAVNRQNRLQAEASAIRNSRYGQRVSTDNRQRQMGRYSFTVTKSTEQQAKERAKELERQNRVLAEGIEEKRAAIARDNTRRGIPNR